MKIRMFYKKRRFLAFWMALTMLILFVPSSRIRAAGNPNPDSVDIYCITEGAASVIGGLTSDQATSYQISTSGWEGTPRYSIISGNSVTVSSTGLVEPRKTVWYWRGGVGTPAYMADADRVETDYYPGDSVVRVTCGNQTQDITIHVIEMGEKYVNDKIREIYDACVEGTTTDLERFTAFTKWVGDHTVYDYRYQSWQSMILYGGGDCWASTNTIIKLCSMAGIDARIRVANQDGGAGSGHRNAVAKIGDTYYVGEAGYVSTTKPRDSSVYEIPLGFGRFFPADGEIGFWQWDGFEEELLVPETLQGRTVTQFGYGSDMIMFHGQEVKTVVLPETVTAIGGRLAFYKTSSLSAIYIPKSVTSIAENLYIDENATIYYEGSEGMWKAISGTDSISMHSGARIVYNRVHSSNPEFLPFTDLPRYKDDGSERWQYTYMRQAYERGLISGDADKDGDGLTTVRPGSTITRGEFMTILYRMAGSPAVDMTDNPFSDVRSQFDAPAILWGYQNGLVSGYPDGTFGRKKAITRAETAKILMMYAEFKDWDTSGAADLSGFLDYDSLRADTDNPHWALPFLSWAVDAGIITGIEVKDGDGNITGYQLSRNGSATRAQVATMLIRFLEHYE